MKTMSVPRPPIMDNMIAMSTLSNFSPGTMVGVIFAKELLYR